VTENKKIISRVLNNDISSVIIGLPLLNIIWLSNLSILTLPDQGIDVIVMVFALSAVDRGFELRSGQTKE
jgi:hypothetical protein